MATKTVAEGIRESAAAALKSDAFTRWHAEDVKPIQGDMVLLNNSFLYRDGISTSKSNNFLGVSVAAGSLLDVRSLGVVAKGPAQNSQFKLFSSKASNIPTLSPVDAAVEREVKSIGRLVFILIGAIDSTVTTTVEIKQGGALTGLRFDPEAPNPVAIEDGVVVTREIDDVETTWTRLEEAAPDEYLVEGGLPASLIPKFTDAFERIQMEAHSDLGLPGADVSSFTQTLLGEVAATTRSQADAYEKALREMEDTKAESARARAEILRIAYNFAGDATKLIRLLISIFDLKPVLMWSTVHEHLVLAEAFRALPWTKSRKKPSLDVYYETIARARNRTFHDFIPFDRSVQVSLDGVDMKAKRLLLFPPYAQRSSAGVEYEDQEIVELLTEFTRAPESIVPLAFWRRNLDVIRALTSLLEATGESLVRLRRASG